MQKNFHNNNNHKNPKLYINKNESHGFNVEQSKPDTKEYELYCWIHKEYKSRENKGIVLEVGIVVTLGDGEWKGEIIKREHRRAFWVIVLAL